jgi:hypothetical protein
MNNWDTMMLKRELFDLFENARILYNDYYRINRNFTKDDIEAIKKLMELVEHNTKEVKEMIKNV